ncbi:lasso peptide biosynthesis B2 protein [Sphingomonas sp. ASV193]|uniref:lasso peptide biosynthesis B2 protein n=1 Tax=Sphingomonas sp. ASV193 TaxID=3144405 RepID=UPI0032E91E27
MNRYSLLPHLSYAIVDDTAIFLDLQADRYFELDQRLFADLVEFDAAAGMPRDEAARRLLEAGLIRAGIGQTGATEIRVRLPSVSGGQGEAAPPRGSLLGSLEVALLVAAAIVRLRLGGLAAILDRFTAVRAGSDPVLVAAFAQQFDLYRRRVPIPRRCLPDSIALAWFLRRRSLTSTLVIGVTTLPFAAHCWIQDLDQVLNDDADMVAGFAPILARSV